MRPELLCGFAYVRSLRYSRDGLHVDLQLENPISSKVSIYHGYPWLGVRSVPCGNDTGNYSDPGTLPALNLKSDSDLDAGVDMGEVVLTLCLLLKTQPERNPTAASILFHP